MTATRPRTLVRGGVRSHALKGETGWPLLPPSPRPTDARPRAAPSRPAVVEGRAVSPARPDARTVAIAAWGTLGVLGLLAQALWRLTPRALEPFADGSLGPGTTALYFGWVAFNVWAEGWRGFHQRFSPRVVARAFHLGRAPRAHFVVLAPLFCMSFFHATRRGVVVAWAMTTAIVALVLIVRTFPQPWRGIVDGGVVIGLALGSLSIVYFFARAAAGHDPPGGADLPERG